MPRRKTIAKMMPKIGVDHAEARGGSMANNLHSTDYAKTFDHCRGIHGAIRARRGVKKATSAARRRHGLQVIGKALEEDES